MKKTLALLLCLLLAGLCACGNPGGAGTEPDTTTVPATSDPLLESTGPQDETGLPDEPFEFSCAVNGTSFFAVLNDGELYHAPLDASQHPKRIPLPLRFEDKALDQAHQLHMEAWRCDTQIFETAKDSLIVGRRVEGNRFAKFRVSLESFGAEPLGISEEAALAPEKIEGDTVTLGKYTYFLETETFQENPSSWNVLTVKLYKGKSKDFNKAEPVYEWKETLYGQAEPPVSFWQLGDIIIMTSTVFGNEWDNDPERKQLGMFLAFNTAIDKPLIESDQRGMVLHDYTPEFVPAPEVEIYSDYVLTPAYIYAVSGGALYRMPRGDIAKQEQIALPEKHDKTALVDSSICGFTEKYLYICRSAAPKDEENYDYTAKRVTYRVALGSLKAELVDAYDSAELPRYNPADGSLLYITDGSIEAFHPDSGKRSKVLNFGDYLGGMENHIDGWFNLPDGTAALKLWNGWASGFATCILFDANDSVRIADRYDLPMVKRQVIEKAEESPRNQAEKHLAKRDDIVTYITCGDYVYYAQVVGNQDEEYVQEKNLYSVKTDGSGLKLLRAKTNIFNLMVFEGKLHCLAYLPGEDFYEESYGFYALGMDGKVTKTIANGYDGEWGGTGLEHVGDLIAVKHYVHWSSENGLSCLYDPKSGAMFSPQVPED